MKSDMHHWVTGISTIVSNETTEEVIVRGHRLSDLIKSATFSEAVFLLVSGRRPTKGQAATLDALMTACVDHAVTPAAMIGRAFASYGTTPMAAVAGGILLFGDIAGAAGNPLAKGLIEAVEANGLGPDAGEERITALARSIVEARLREGGRVPGFGIPAHQTDPRAPALIEVARRNDVLGIYTKLMLAMEAELASRKGRPIPMNLDGVVAGLILDFGFPWESAAAFVMIPRSFSTVTHYLEEKAQGTRWRHSPSDGVVYTGPMPK